MNYLILLILLIVHFKMFVDNFNNAMPDVDNFNNAMPDVAENGDLRDVAENGDLRDVVREWRSSGCCERMEIFGMLKVFLWNLLNNDAKQLIS